MSRSVGGQHFVSRAGFGGFSLAYFSWFGIFPVSGFYEFAPDL
jgi:hypothetical protein